MKRRFSILIILFIAGLIIVSCKKKSSEPTPSSSMSATINNVTYSGNSEMTFTNATSGLFQFTTNASAYYGSYTYTNQSSAPYIYNYVLTQMEIVSSGDTIYYQIQISSQNQISSGTYSIIGPSDPISASSGPISRISYYRTGNGTKGVTDSTCTGTLNITQFDMSQKLASGTFSLTDTRTYTSNPVKIIITNGQFSNLTLQEF